MNPSWRLDELAHAGPEHLDPAFVAAYNRKQGPFPTDDVVVLQRHGLDAAATLVDLATGTGRLALAAAPHCRRVIAVDVSPAMLANVRAGIAEAALTNVDVVQAGFLSYEHHGPPADAVYTRNALHQLPDFWKVAALRRIATLLRPGGVLRLRDLIFDCAPGETGALIDGWLARAHPDPATGYTADDLAEHIRTEHSTYRWLLEPMLDATGFDVVDVEYRAGIYGAYVCLRR